jgi:hypothetical protein
MPANAMNPYKRLSSAGAEEGAEQLDSSGEIGGERPSGAKAQLILSALSARLKSCPFKKINDRLCGGRRQVLHVDWRVGQHRTAGAASFVGNRKVRDSQNAR